MRLSSPVALLAVLVLTVLVIATLMLSPAIGSYIPRGNASTASSPALVASAQTPTPPGITVTGMGVVKGTPDIAFITVGVESNQATAQEAQREAADKINAALDKIRSLGVADKDIQTTGLNLAPVYDRNGTTITGYRATNQLRITVQDINRTGELLDAAVSAGANRGGQIQMGFKDDTKLRQDALDAAVRSAQDKAGVVAKALGVALGSVESVSEESVSGPVAPAMLGAPVAPQGGAPSPVLPGEISITAQVRVTYGLR